MIVLSWFDQFGFRLRDYWTTTDGSSTHPFRHYLASSRVSSTAAWSPTCRRLGGVVFPQIILIERNIIFQKSCLGFMCMKLYDDILCRLSLISDLQMTSWITLVRIVRNTLLPQFPVSTKSASVQQSIFIYLHASSNPLSFRINNTTFRGVMESCSERSCFDRSHEWMMLWAGHEVENGLFGLSISRHDLGGSDFHLVVSWFSASAAYQRQHRSSNGSLVRYDTMLSWCYMAIYVYKDIEFTVYEYSIFYYDHLQCAVTYYCFI